VHELTVIAGEAFGLRSPVVKLWPTLNVHAAFAHGARSRCRPTWRARVFVVQGELVSGETPLAGRRTRVLEPGTNVKLRALGDTRGGMLLGGAHFATPRFIWWNFVASSGERIRARQKSAGNASSFRRARGTEFIPRCRITEPEEERS